MDANELIYNHYTETCEIQRNSTKERNKLFIFLCLIIGLQYLLMISNDATVFSINSLLKEKWSIDFTFSATIIQCVCWIFFLYVSMRYIQSNVYIERQYNYIHNIEEKLSNNDNILVEREGKAYLDDYPFVSNYIDFIYKWVMPIVFVITASLKIILEIINFYNFLALTFDIVLAILVIILWVAYLIFLHKKKNS